MSNRKKTWADRSPAYKARHAKKRELRRQLLSHSRPFIGVDGEGVTLKSGRHEYRLLCIGDRALRAGAGGLSTKACLDFILSAQHTDDALLVSYAFGYDVSMILRDMLPNPSDPRDRQQRAAGRIKRLLEDKPYDDEKAETRYTFWPPGPGGYAIEWLPHNYFRVARTQPRWAPIINDWYPSVVEGSARTIWDAFRLFGDRAFAEVIRDWRVGTQRERNLIGRMKDQRAGFRRINRAIVGYCQLECRLLGQLLDHAREVCRDVGVLPATWTSAGQMATVLLRDNGVLRRVAPKGKDEPCVESVVPSDVRTMSKAGYFGGRFEITASGRLPACQEYDRNAAYPASMRGLPCLEHGRWERIDGAALAEAEADPAALYLAEVSFRHGIFARDCQGGRINLCGLPTRVAGGRLIWPAEGSGTYWSDELRAARLLGCEIRYKAGWRFIPGCDHDPFAWITPLYEWRLTLGRTTQGTMIKGAMNAIAGKFVQRIGQAAYGNFIWGGLITARNRAEIIRAVAGHPQAVAMIATDAVVSFEALPLPLGAGLGQWTHTAHDSLFVVQPGLYWGQRLRKRRGVPMKFFEGRDPDTGERRTDTFERVWREYAARCGAGDGLIVGEPPPRVEIPMHTFVGFRLALARDDLARACQWVRTPRALSFDWGDKRGGLAYWQGQMVRHGVKGGPIAGRPYAANEAGLLDLDKLQIADQPDVIDISIPWKS